MVDSISFGYLQPSPSVVSDLFFSFHTPTSECSIDLDNGPSGETLTCWSRGTNIRVTSNFKLDLQQALTDIGFEESAKATNPLGAALRWYCPSTATRYSTPFFPVQNNENSLDCLIDGWQVKESVDVQLVIGLRESPSAISSPASPSVVGSILLTSSCRLRVEGIGALPSVRIIDFAENNFANKNAQWEIRLEPDLEIHSTRGLSVYLNSRNRTTTRVLKSLRTKSPSSEAQLWLKFLQVEVRKTMAWFAASQALETDLSEFADDPDSFGYELDLLLHGLFPDEDRSTLAEKLLSNPGLMDARIHDLMEEQCN
ncbi:hypothetical protein CUROG_00635 [Corynebacterium urogenitale]|uniref:Uncharacterized protein n=1 Tax=Corynebacterium urogenitale TaxID=2487892 RepID=A0A5J6Z5A2_9CORY|nr:hypothetical protein [Corynebacterium urogenitale]QFQ01531.1 hypothetical protein CUROG_00635 [Corynebacterium urogenitale]